jgi:DNA (cytosine-5)-methyltransferase 1
MLTVGSLFAGIEGIGLGLERTGGFKTVWQVEIDDYATKVLEKHWPDVRRWRDVRTFPPRSWEFSYSWRGLPAIPFAPDVKRETTRDEWYVDLICGGFPCTDISYAGKGAGLAGEHSGLWYEFARVIRILRPRYVLVENVAALLTRGLDAVLGTLASLGYDAEWFSLDAKRAGIPQRGRDRTFLLAYTSGMFSNGGNDNSNGRGDVRFVFPKSRNGNRETLPGRGHWETDHPGVLRMANGISSRIHRLRCLGNAVVPQVAEWIGNRILEAENFS